MVTRAIEACRPLLSSTGKRIVHVGGYGLGSALKMVNNLLAQWRWRSLRKGPLGQAPGVPLQTMFDVLLGGPMVAALVGAKRARIEHDDYDADFSMRWMQRDLHLASVSGYEAGVPMPVVNVTKELYRFAMREGFADQDYGAIYAFLNGAAAREFSRSSPEYTAVNPRADSLSPSRHTA